MATISYQRRQARSALNYWYFRRLENLRKAYPSGYSDEKEDAWKHCVEECNEHNGYGLGVLSHNGYMFTAGFKFLADDGTEMFYYITRGYEIAIPVEEEN